ncbi:acyl carrier protein [Actinosynnema sp. ALI-1.44]|uniref:acyl carrier protein n=1 Tax=Actinosynnema sp. ALI-1.44 TaxID=1933779 RepID=UPI001EDBC943|nr:acyl carrier protein [Actinosynnema sp. ALI-1.44]
MADLAVLMRRVAGADEDAVELGTGNEDTGFDDLGYDSLALLETMRAVEREYGVRLPDDILAESTNPGELLALVNLSLARS